MQDGERGSFYSSLPDGEYRLADIPYLKDLWLKSFNPATDSGDDAATVVSIPEVKPIAPSPSGMIATQDVRVIVRGGKLAGIRVGDNEPTMSFARSRDFEHKWTDK